MKTAVRSRLPWLFALLLGAACGGGGGSPGEGTGGDGQGGEGGDGGGEGGGGTSGTPSTKPPVSAPCKLADTALPPARVWRLSRMQYANTLEQTFGVDVPLDKIPFDVTLGEGYAKFDTLYTSAIVDAQLAEAMREVAGLAAKTLAPKAIAENGCLAKKPAEGACVDGFVATYGAKAFRRPLADEEKKRFGDFFKGAVDKWDGNVATRLTIEAFLMSPRFVYRTELGAGGSGRVALTSHEVASQLSYLFADVPPDAELTKLADDNKLRDPAIVRAQAARLVNSAGARKKVVDFFSQLLSWKGIGEGAIAKDAERFPKFKDELGAAFADETSTFIEKVLWDEKGTLKTLFAADYSYLNATLAAHYGASAPGAELKKTTLPGERRGILGHGSVLSALGHPNSTSPAIRGVMFRNRLLCQTIPDPPPGAADQAAGKVFDTNAPMNTQREHLEFARKAAPDCVACHGTFVPFGLGLEQFDAIGKYRKTEFGKTLDTSVELKGFGPADGMYKDSLELASKIVESPAGQRCFVTQLGTYGFGRHVDEEAEACELDGLASKFKDKDLRVQDLLIELTQTDSFFNRRSGS